MTVAVVRFGGSNCDRDAVRALESVGVDATIAWHADGLPEDCSGVLLPGGFSYGDYLRAGAMAARSPIMDEVRAAVEAGIPVLGVCNGAQIGCEAGLAPGAFTVNESARFQCEHVHCRVETTDTRWTRHYDEGEVIQLPIAHGEGRYEVADEADLDALADEDRVLFRYCDAEGNVTPAANANGSRGNIAGVLGPDGAGVMMPHPERAALPELGGTDGRAILRGFEA
ncbi:MAG: phosphoribosylformylglycinamidine synthase I [Halobacteriaceae archaeon]